MNYEVKGDDNHDIEISDYEERQEKDYLDLRKSMKSEVVDQSQEIAKRKRG